VCVPSWPPPSRREPAPWRGALPSSALAAPSCTTDPFDGDALGARWEVRDPQGRHDGPDHRAGGQRDRAGGGERDRGRREAGSGVAAAAGRPAEAGRHRPEPSLAIDRVRGTRLRTFRRSGLRVDVEPGRKVRKALAKARGSVRATLTLRLTSGEVSRTDRAAVVLAGARARRSTTAGRRGACRARRRLSSG
jgi:hypothetical protein